MAEQVIDEDILIDELTSLLGRAGFKDIDILTLLLGECSQEDPYVVIDYEELSVKIEIKRETVNK